LLAGTHNTSVRRRRAAERLEKACHVMSDGCSRMSVLSGTGVGCFRKRHIYNFHFHHMFLVKFTELQLGLGFSLSHSTHDGTTSTSISISLPHSLTALTGVTGLTWAYFL
jgi:hypothetical protein